MLYQRLVTFQQRTDSRFFEAPYGDSLACLLVEPASQVVLRKVRKPAIQFMRNPHQPRAQFEAVVQPCQQGETVVRQMNVQSALPEREVDRQAAENVKAAARACNQNVLAIFKVAQDRQIEFQVGSV